MFTVRALELAPQEQRTKLLEETFNERRLWILTDGPGMTDVLQKFSVFIRCPEEVSPTAVISLLLKSIQISF